MSAFYDPWKPDWFKPLLLVKQGLTHH
jgi:hypothetical protein